MSTVLIEEIEPGSADAGVPAHYGDPMREQRLLDTAVALVDRSNRDVIAVPGEEPDPGDVPAHRGWFAEPPVDRRRVRVDLGEERVVLDRLES